MDSNRFFLFLNRLNAVLLALVGLGVLLLIGSEFLRPLRFDVAEKVAGPQAGDASDVSYDFGGLDFGNANNPAGKLTVLAGTSDAVMVLRRLGGRRPGPILSSGGYGRDETNVNVLVVDTATAKSRWIFAGVKRAIGAGFLVYASTPSKTLNDNPVTALLMSVADKDTDGNGIIDDSDDQSLYIYRPGSASAVKLLDAKAISNVIQLDAGKVVVTYFDGETDRTAIYAASDFKLLAQEAVAATPDK